MQTLELAPLRAVARRFPEARLIVLFGSVARGEATPLSDADLGVLGVPFWRGLELAAALGAVLGREPHLVELERAPDWLRFRVAREGVLLGEGEPFAWARFQAEAAVRWFDLEPIVTLCADGARRRLRGEQPHG